VQESHEAADLAIKGDIADLRKESIPGLLAWMLSSKSLNAHNFKFGSIVVAALGAFTLIFKFL